MISYRSRMTQQQNARKAFPSLTREAVARPPLTQTKGSGDSTNQKHRSRSKSKNKVPKSIRYDLENALVSLCDVWFEEIKPYLVRNNVKVHVHEVAGGQAGGDRSRLPIGAPTCSHLDPGAASDHRRLPCASYASYCSTQPTASRAQCRRPRALQTSQPHPRISPSIQNPCHNFTETEESKPRKQRRRKSISHSHPQSPSAPVSCLCRTYSIPPNISHDKSKKSKQISEKGSKFTKCVAEKQCDIALQIKPKMKDKIVQTEKIGKDELKVHPKITPCLTKISRQNATVKQMKTSLNRGFTKAFPLFQKDLIDIIAEKNDSRLQVLYARSNNEEYPSVMNLMSSSKTMQNIPLQKKPWR